MRCLFPTEKVGYFDKMWSKRALSWEVLVIWNGVSDVKRDAERKTLNTFELWLGESRSRRASEGCSLETFTSLSVKKKTDQSSLFSPGDSQKKKKITWRRMWWWVTYIVARWLESFSRLLRWAGFKLTPPGRMLWAMGCFPGGAFTAAAAEGDLGQDFLGGQREGGRGTHSGREDMHCSCGCLHQ